MNKDLHIRVSAEDHAAITAKANAVDITISHLVREASLKAQVVLRNPICDAQWVALASLTANLNQLTKAVNRGALPASLLPQLVALTAQLAEIRKVLL